MFFLLLCVCQFPDTVEFCEEMANMGKTIIVAALDGTFQRKVGMNDESYPTFAACLLVV